MSDRYLTENCSILDNAAGMYCAEFTLSSYAKGKNNSVSMKWIKLVNPELEYMRRELSGC